MKYLKIKNSGELNKELFFLMGASTKKKDDTKIGQFGTGLKYAISYLLRTGTDFRFFIGKEELLFEVETKEINGVEFNTITLDGRSMNITTDYGYQWEAWEAIREIYCNAKDEGNFSSNVTESTQSLPGYTTVLIEMNDEISEVFENWGSYFIKEDPIFSNEKYSIYNNTDKSNCRIYKNGILVRQLDTPSLFHYDFKNCQLNELRQYMGYAPQDIATIILNSNKEIVSSYLERFWNKEDKIKFVEDALDFQFWYDAYDKEKVRDIFSGRIYLHETSSANQNEYLVKPDKHLFKILESCGLECEIVKRSYGGGWYGGSSYNDEDVPYKEIESSDLRKRIDFVLKKHMINVFQYKTVVDISQKNFDFIHKGETVFNCSINSLNDADLEVIVIAAVVHANENGTYSSYKRLLKRALNDKFFKKAIFKKNE